RLLPVQPGGPLRPHVPGLRGRRARGADDGQREPLAALVLPQRPQRLHLPRGGRGLGREPTGAEDRTRAAANSRLQGTVGRPFSAFRQRLGLRCQDSGMPRVVAKDRRRDDIADRLKEAIESRGFKVAKLERLMKRSRGYINDALRGQKRLSVELILVVMTKLNADPQEVFAPWHPQHRDR